MGVSWVLSTQKTAAEKYKDREGYDIMNTEIQKSPESFDPIPEAYRIFTDNGRILGHANLIFDQDSVFFLNFEIVEKRRGHGLAIVESFLHRMDVKGVSTPGARKFWLSFGAVMEEDGSFIIKKRGGL